MWSPRRHSCCPGGDLRRRLSGLPPLAIAIAPLLVTGSVRGGEIPFGEGTVGGGANGVSSAVAADLDRDGDLDVVSASGNDDTVAWYENDGAASPVFIKHVITLNADGASAVVVDDLDGDGDADVVVTARNDDLVAWYENDGAATPGFTEHVISLNADRASSVATADLDHDGDRDVVSASNNDDKIAWYESDGATPPAFVEHVISLDAEGALSVAVADMDGDGDVDVLSASTFGVSKVAWYENDGGSPPLFTEWIITTEAIGSTSVCAADVDGDGDMDALASSGFDDTIAWYENDGGSPPLFEEHVIATDADFARSVFATDLDCDGDVDVLSASSSDNTIAWYENDGGQPPAFTTWIISTTAGGATSVFTADLDGDRDLDVLASASVDDAVPWYENQSPPVFDPCPADLDGDGSVGFDDFLAILEAWGDCPVTTCCPGDLDGDRIVGPADFVAIFAAWGDCPQPGACCIDDHCVPLTAAECVAAGGVFKGDGSTCREDPCGGDAFAPGADGDRHVRRRLRGRR